MANPDFKKFLVNDVIFAYPKLDAPYRFDKAEGRSKECAKTAPGAAYSVTFQMSLEEGRAFHDKLADHYKECKKRNSKLKAFDRVFGFKETDDGLLFNFSAKKKAISNAGKENEMPKMVDGAKKVIENRRIGSGSTGNIVVVAHPSTDPDNHGGISLLLDKMQVLNAVYNSEDDDFDIHDDNSKANNDKSNDNSSSSALDLDDEIPF